MLSSSTWKLSYAIASIYPIGRWTRLASYTRFALLRPFCFLSPSFDRRLRSLQLIAVRSNGSSISANIIAIMSRPRSKSELKVKRNVCLRRTLSCVCTGLLSFYTPGFSQSESFGIPPFPRAPILIHHSFSLFPFYRSFCTYQSRSVCFVPFFFRYAGINVFISLSYVFTLLLTSSSPPRRRASFGLYSG